MLDSIIERFKQRRAERLAQRGYNIKKKQYRKSDGEIKVSKKELLKDIEHFDEPEEESTEGWNKYQARRGQPRGEESGGSHGNTRLPFGLCKRYGIEIGEGWTPRDAWDALAGKGITAEGAYRRLKEGKDPGEADNPVDTTSTTGEGVSEGAKPEEVKPEEKKPVDYFTTDKGKKVTDLKTDYYGWAKSRYRITGTLKDEGDYRYFKSFETKGDMYLFLKDMGVEQITDPETGEVVNPTEMEFPELIFKSYAWDDKSYTAPSIGMRDGRYAVVAKDLDGKSKVLETAGTFADAKDFLIRHGVPEDKIKLSPALKKREKERTAWLTSDKKEYIEKDGVRYGDIRVKKDDFVGEWEIDATSEDGKTFWKRFPSKMAALKFLKDNGVENGKVDGEFINPQEVDIPETVAHVGTRDYQKIFYDTDSDSGRIAIYGIDIDGNRLRLFGMSPYESFDLFKKRITEGHSDFPIDKVEVSDEMQKKIEATRKKDEERERRKAEFREKAVAINGGMFADLEMSLDSLGRPVLQGYNSQGDLRRIYYTRKAGEMVKLMDNYGVSVDSVKMSDDAKKLFDEYKEMKNEFDKKAVDIGGTKYADPEILPTGYGKFVVTGKDEYGDGQTIMDANEIGDVVKAMQDLGADVDSMMKKQEVKDAYEKHKKFVAEFDKKAIPIYGVKYADLELMYNGGEYILTGKDVKGRKRRIDYSRRAREIKDILEKSGASMENVSMDDDARRAYDRKMKEYKAIESGEYHELDDCAFKNLRIDKLDGIHFVIRGDNIDGDNIDIYPPAISLDEAMEILEAEGITDYKIFDKRAGKEMVRPENGMRRVKMMRTPGGQFKIMATVGKSKTKEVYSTNSEEDARNWLREKGVDESNIQTKGMNPNDDVPRSHTQKSLENFDTHRSESEDKYPVLSGMTQEQKQEVVNMMTDVFQNGAYRMRREGHFADIVLGHFKNTLETGTSGGATGDSLRRGTERKMFGLEGHEAVDGEKYGYVGLEDDETEFQKDVADGYGGFVYKFKKDAVQDRATYSCGDSLDSSPEGESRPLAGYAGQKPTYEGVSALYSGKYQEVMELYERYKRGLLDYESFLGKFSRKCRDGYIECHYHGMLTIEDVESITVGQDDITRTFRNLTEKRAKEVVKKLKDCGTMFRVVMDDGEMRDAYELIEKEFGIQ